MANLPQAVEQPTTPEALADQPPVPVIEPRPPSEPIPYPSPRTLLRWLMVVLALYAVYWLLTSAGAAMAPFAVGLLLAYLLSPLVNILNRRLPRWAAILIVYLGLVWLIVALLAFLVPPVANQISQLINAWPTMDELQRQFNLLLDWYQRQVPADLQTQINTVINNGIVSIRANVNTYVQQAGAFVFNQVIQVVSLATFLVGFLIIPIWLFYVLNDEEQGRQTLNRLLHHRIRSDFWNVWNIINRVLSDYIRGQLVLGLIIAVMVGAGLFILDLFPGFEIDYILLLAIVAGFTELIPIVGPVIGAVPGVLLAFFGPGGSVTSGLVVLGLYIVIQQIENNFLVPRIIGESVGVHPAILIVVLIAMGQVFGLPGVILAPPTCAIARDLFLYVYHRLGGIGPMDAIARISRKAEAETEKQLHASA